MILSIIKLIWDKENQHSNLNLDKLKSTWLLWKSLKVYPQKWRHAIALKFRNWKQENEAMLLLWRTKNMNNTLTGSWKWYFNPLISLVVRCL